MLNEIRCNTWTLDNIGRGSGIFLKSQRDGKSFREVLKWYDVNNKGYDYTIHDSRKDTISKEEYEKKSKEIFESAAGSGSQLHDGIRKRRYCIRSII